MLKLRMYSSETILDVRGISYIFCHFDFTKSYFTTNVNLLLYFSNVLVIPKLIKNQLSLFKVFTAGWKCCIFTASVSLFTCLQYEQVR